MKKVLAHLKSLFVQKTPLRITLIYLAVGLLWILFSDLILVAAISGDTFLIILQALKGWVYVLATAGLLYILIRHDVRALQKSQETLRRQALIFKHLTDAIIITDLERRITDWNPAAEVIFGYSREEMLGQTTAILHQPGETERTHKAISAGIAETGYWSGEINYIRKDGRQGVCETIIVPLLDETGTPVARVGINRDITHRRQLEAQLQQAQKMEAIGRLAGGVAHDFNNLLTVIIGYTELLETLHLDADSPIHQDLAQIKRASQRAADLTRRLLAFSRQQILQPKILNLNTVILDLEKMLKRLIGEDIQFMSVLEEQLYPVKVDPAQLEQVIMNLVINSRDAMPEGGELIIETANLEWDNSYAHPTLEIEPGSYVTLTITDTGHGMDRETQSKIFEPFFTTKERNQGTGLGLAMVLGIVQQSGGSIRVYSEPGWGTTFKIYFPRAKESLSASAPAPIQPISWYGTETILVVEDESGVRDLIHQILSEYGYTILTAQDGAEAIRQCQEAPDLIHLLLTDIVLPDINGINLAEKLCEQRPHLKILYMSGYTDKITRLSDLLKLNHLFLQKPFTPYTLLRQVREALVHEVAA